ncbi:oligosaccharide transporter (flippase) [Listeria weihenstephanensis FSL R9-0317]|uniref:Polysaccharide biosynthesis protein n=2 Tax=Listeria weihenstephanensis TaxID=1006155 RepID=A0A1S7FVG2_9LIST|nr:hypothetical protein [Listeria weihenstephanensis]AQY51335.1 hypothetical protein UE46_09880 [Listeria weihenstephanensis]EUJ37129.1 oligosaccharide transporter (flippase) [Listeria weihenstephanensis FSL R9-0317]
MNKYMKKNIIIGVGMQSVYLLASFGIRTLFIHTLGEVYVGMDRLFSNILTLLSFAELGIGEAIIFQLYKPVVQKNYDKARDFLLFYRKIYRWIGSLIFILGLCLVPYIMSLSLLGEAGDVEVGLIFILYVANTSLSYFFTYRKALFLVQQQEYINVLYKQGSFLVQAVLQGIYLYMTHDLIGFLVIQILCTFLFNLFQSMYAYRKFPEYLKGRPNPLEKLEIRAIVENVKGIVLYMASGALVFGTESIFITYFLGLQMTGIYSNYTLIFSAVVSILARAMRGLLGSLGQMNAKNDLEQSYRVFNKLYLVIGIVYSVIGLMLFFIINPFIGLWIGDSFILPQYVVLVLVIQFFINGMQYPAYSYRTTLGLYTNGRLSPVALIFIYGVLSVLLIPRIGVAGSALSMFAARLCTTTWVDPYLVFHDFFKRKSGRFIWRHYGIITLCIMLLSLLTIIIW